MNTVSSKKRSGFIALFMAALLLVSAFFAACNSNKSKQVDLKAVYDKLIASGKLPALTKISEQDLYESYGIEKDKLKQWVFALSENYAVEAGEVALFEVSDESYADTLVNKLQDHLDRIKAVAQNYNQSETAKVEPVEVTRVGNFVYFVVGEDYDALMKILKDNIG